MKIAEANNNQIQATTAFVTLHLYKHTRRVKLEFVGQGCNLGRANVMGAHTMCKANVGGTATNPNAQHPVHQAFWKSIVKQDYRRKSLKVLVQGTLETVQRMCSWV